MLISGAAMCLVAMSGWFMSSDFMKEFYNFAGEHPIVACFLGLVVAGIICSIVESITKIFRK